MENDEKMKAFINSIEANDIRKSQLQIHLKELLTKALNNNDKSVPLSLVETAVVIQILGVI